MTLHDAFLRKLENHKWRKPTVVIRELIKDGFSESRIRHILWLLIDKGMIELTMRYKIKKIKTHTL